MTPDNNNENSRMEDILTGMLNNTPSSELLEAHSRVEELLLQVLDKMNAGGGGGSGGGAVMVETTFDQSTYQYISDEDAINVYEDFASGKPIILHIPESSYNPECYIMVESMYHDINGGSQWGIFISGCANITSAYVSDDKIVMGVYID